MMELVEGRIIGYLINKSNYLHYPPREYLLLQFICVVSIAKAIDKEDPTNGILQLPSTANPRSLYGL